MCAELKLYTTDHIPWVGKAYIFVVVEPDDRFGGMFTETFVFWTSLQVEQSIPLDNIRTRYNRSVMAVRDPCGQPVIDRDSALASALDWSRGPIHGVVLGVYQDIVPRPEFPRVELTEIKLHNLMHLWGTDEAHEDIVAILNRSGSGSATEFLRIVTRMPKIVIETPDE